MSLKSKSLQLSALSFKLTQLSTQYSVLSTRHSVLGTCAVRWFLTAIVFTWIPLTTQAQPSGELASAGGEPALEEEARNPTFELGSFKIKDLRPTRNETARLTFTVHLSFPKSFTAKQIAPLESWEHRLRDQVITAVRISEMKDFQEPDLRYLRRRILIRVNRLLKAKFAQDVLVTEYLFRLH